MNEVSTNGSGSGLPANSYRYPEDQASSRGRHQGHCPPRRVRPSVVTEVKKGRAWSRKAYEVPEDDYTLQLDLDDADSVVRFVDGLAILQENLPELIKDVRIMPETPGHYHVVVGLAGALDVGHRIALQAVLGSDLRREALMNLVRVYKGEVVPDARD